MPRRRWRLKARREPLSAAMRLYLERGLGAVLNEGKQLDGYHGAAFIDGARDRAAAWAEYGQEILADWIVEHPGSRPWGWWQHDARAPRACLEGVEYVYRGANPGDGAWIWKQEFGLPGRPQVRKPGAAPARLVFESEASYLHRLNLLLPGAAERLTAEDFEPEIVEIPELPELGPVRPVTPAPAVASTNDAPRRPAA